MTDADFKYLMNQLMQKRRKEAVDSLLFGNDTCCFTTEQYVRRWVKLGNYKDEKFGFRMMNWPAREGMAETLAHWHLSTYSRLIEVRPDVWTERNP